MPESPLQAAGAQIDPSAAAPLHTNEWFTGMLTNGNPLGPGAVPYLYQKFYSASRYDRLVDGANSEITARATLGRRPGNTAVNASPGSAAQRLYLFPAVNTNGQNSRLLADLGTTVADVTGTSTDPLFTKSGGAGRACFQAVGNTCYIGDGIDLKKYMQAGQVWQPNTVYSQGAIIIDPNGNVQVAETFATLSITGVQIIKYAGNFYAIVSFNSEVLWGAGPNVTFSGLQAYQGLNGVTTAGINPATIGFNNNSNQWAFALPGAQAIYSPAPDVGSATTQPAATTGQSGGFAPTWSTVPPNFTTDGNIFWQCFGAPVYPWAPPAPTQPPTYYLGSGNVLNYYLRFWVPSAILSNGGGTPLYRSIIDGNNNVELLIIPAATTLFSGAIVPTWSQVTPSATSAGGVTVDGTASWQNCGPAGSWVTAFTFYANQCIRDTNGNLQVVTAGGGGASGGAAPAWATAVGATTNDGALTWTNVGAGYVFLTAARQYFYAYHTISGQVTTLSPAAVLNPNGSAIGTYGGLIAQIGAPKPAAPDIDEVWFFATAQGGSVPLLLGRVSVNNLSAFTIGFVDNFPDSFLNAEIVGPQNHLNDPPPMYFVPAAYHLGLVCGFVGNVLFYSNGIAPVGNPNESFPPSNFFQLPSTPIAAWSTSLGLIIMRIDGISVMLGSNTASNPLYVVNIFDSVGLAARDAFATRGNSLYMMTTTGKVIRFTTSQFIAAIQGQEGISQALPDDEIGFPIGDLLAQFTPANCYLAWYEGPSNDSGLFVCDGSGSWYMMRTMKLPDEVAPWSPKATIATGISCIYAAETSPGVTSLLIGTPAGPIWKRDTSTNADAGFDYAASAIVSPIVLSEPGNTVTLQFITTEEKKIAGAAPLTVGVLFDETSGTFRTLRNVTNDPPNLPPSKTIGVQRFQTQQDAGTIPVCRYVLEQISWPAQNFPNELLTNTLYGRLPARTHR
jgi:hypothetical protein